MISSPRISTATSWVPTPNWMTGKEFTDIAKFLRPGKNVLAVRGENAPGPKDANPAGLACNLEVVLSDDTKVVVRSDDAWRCSRDEADGWRKTDFDDRDWAKGRVVAKFGEGPWGHTLGGGVRDEFLTPYAAGLPGVVRVVYLPRPARHGAEAGARYALRRQHVRSGFRPSRGDRPGPPGCGRFLDRFPAGRIGRRLGAVAAIRAATVRERLGETAPSRSRL